MLTRLSTSEPPTFPSTASPQTQAAIPPTLAQIPSTPTTGATPLGLSTLPSEASIAATPITPFVKGPSLGLDNWSPDSRWLPYVDFSDRNAQTLHFYDPARSTTCDFPFPIHDPNPDRFIAWLPDGRVVVQAADKVMAGTPCGTFRPATAPDILVLDHQDPSFSPDGRYQVIMKPYPGSSQGPNEVIDLKDAVSGKNLVETAFIDVPRGGGNLPGYWLDAAHFLIIFTGDQGPLLLTPGKPAIQIAAISSTSR